MVALLFVLFAVVMRFLPHPWGFTPVAASLLFFGARGARRRLWLPLLLLIASDLYLTKVVYAYRFTWDQSVTWAWYAAMLCLGTTLRETTAPLRIVLAAFTSSVSFFLLSNFAFWTTGMMYPRTFSGLMACYLAGLPFFRHSAEGDLLFTSLMFATPLLFDSLASLFSRGKKATV